MTAAIERADLADYFGCVPDVGVMPQYHGLVSHLVDVAVTVVRAYLVWLFIMAVVLPAPFVIWAAAAGDAGGALRGFLPQSLEDLSSRINFVHPVSFASLVFFLPARFPYASPIVTFAIAAALGSGLLVLNWSLLAGEWTQSALITRSSLAVAETVAAGLFGALIFRLNRSSGLGEAPGKWIGWLVVGRGVCEAYAAEEAVRLQRECDDYAKSVRKRG